MPTDLPLDDLLPQPIVDRLDQFRQTRKLSSIRDALIVALAEFFEEQSSASVSPAVSQASDSSSEIAALQRRLSQVEVMLLELVSRVEQMQPVSTLSPIAPVIHRIVDDTDDDIEDEPDEILYSFLSPAPSPSVYSQQNSGFPVSTNKNLASQSDEDEPDEILYSFLEPEKE
ncbi:MAG TPA: hypothetical protein V6D10_14320 [Trichocoleus sp.]